MNNDFKVKDLPAQILDLQDKLHSDIKNDLKKGKGVDDEGRGEGNNNTPCLEVILK